VDLVAEMVKDQTSKDFEEAQHQRDMIQDELDDMRQALEQIRETQRAGRGIESVSATSEAGAKVVSSKHDMIQTISQVS
jgi:DNA-binding protein YbaB